MDMFFYNTDKSLSRKESFNSKLKVIPYSSYGDSHTYQVHAKAEDGWDEGVQIEMQGSRISEYDIIQAYSKESNTHYLDASDINDLLEEGEIASERWAFIRAAQQGDAFTVSRHLKEETQEQSTIQSALTWASQEGHKDVVTQLIPQLEPSQDSKEALGFSMERAIASRHESVAKTLSSHVDLTHDDSLYLRMACYTEQVDLAKVLLDGSNVQDAMTRLVKDNQDMKAMLASEEGGYEKGIEVLSSISTVTAQSHVYTDEMMLLGEVGDTQAIGELLAKGANPQDAIYEASIFGHLDTVKVLVEAGADVDEGLSASTVTGQKSVFDHLLPKASQEGVDRALVNASDHGQNQLAQTLLEHGADPFFKKGLAFDCAIRSNRQDTLNLLASHTDDLSFIKDKHRYDEDALDMLQEASSHLQEDYKRSRSYSL